MKNMQKLLEQRKHKRFAVKDDAYAVLKYKPTKMGQIINMSRDGPAVRYSSNGQQLSESSELDIFIVDSNFYIETIQAKIISDFAIADKTPFSSPKNRQRCFQFGEIKSHQLFQLDYLLQNYTKGRCPDKNLRQLDYFQIKQPCRMRQNMQVANNSNR